MGLDISADGPFEIGDGFEDAAADFSAGDGREESFDGIEPRRRGRREMAGPSRMVGQPPQDIGMLVRGVVVSDGMNDLAGWNGSLHGVEETDKFLMPMLFHAASNYGSVEDVERGEKRSHAVAFVIMRHCPALAGLERQSRLCAVERLDLAFLVDGDDDGVSGRVHVEADDILDLRGEIWIVGALESADAMRLQAMRFPQALDGAKRYAGGLGHGAPGPMGDLARRFGTGQLQNLGDNFRRERRPAGFARLVAQEAIDALLTISPLPTPDSGAAGARPPRDFQHWQALGGKQHDLRPLNLLERTISIADDRKQALAIFGADYDVDGLGHAARVAYPVASVNPTSASVH